MADSATIVDGNYASVDDVRNLISYPVKLDDGAIEQFIREGGGELNSILSMFGIGLPLTAPQFFLDMLRNAVAHKAAALIAVRFPPGAGPDIAQAAVNLYNAEFIRIRDWLVALTQGNLIAIGILPDTTTPPGYVLNMGHVLTKHHWPERDDEIDLYPIIRIP